MNGRKVSYFFFLFFSIAIIAVAQSDKGEVSISGTTVSLKCPGEQRITWMKGSTPLNTTSQTLELTDYSEKNDGLYHCKYHDKPIAQFHFFYIKAKVCAGCVDLNMVMAALLVFADIMFTLVIIVLVYFCARKKTGAPPPQRATQARPARGQGRGPPVPDPDYQMLNPATRSNDVYAQAQRR